MKHLRHIPPDEIEETKKCVRDEFDKMKEITQISNQQSNSEQHQQMEQTDELPILDEIWSAFETEECRDSDEDELDRYYKTKTPHLDQDPLVWWKEYEKTFPTLAHLARMFLAVPASQATTERTFSTAGNIVTEKRTRLTPEHVEKLVLFNKNAQFFDQLELEQDHCCKD